MMTTIESMTILPEQFVDKTVLFYGPTKTGKSFLIDAILAALSKHVEQAIVFCTSDPQTGAYSASGIMPAQMVHSSLTQEMLESICERQDALMAASSTANKPEVISSLFQRIPPGKWRQVIDTINRKLAARAVDTSVSDEALKQYKEDAAAALQRVKKAAIKVHRDWLGTLALTPDEVFALRFMFMNPRMVLVFDDCTPELNALKKAEVVKKIFFQGRWSGITALVAAHTDKALDPEIKKGVFVSIFTSSLSVREFFDRASNNIDTETKRTAISAATSVFSETPHQKLVYFRDGGFKKVVAKKPAPYSLCNAHITSVCKKIEAETTAGVSRNNRFYSAFQVAQGRR